MNKRMTIKPGALPAVAALLMSLCALQPVLAQTASSVTETASSSAAAATSTAGPASGAVEAATGNSARAADALPPIEVRYAVSWGGLGVGKIDVALKPDVPGGCYAYTAISHPTALARSLYGAPNESSQFCVKDGRVRSKHFNSLLPGDEKQSYSLNFDWDKHTATDENGLTRSIPPDAVDSFALQQAVRLWVSAHAKDAQPPVAEFDMVDRKNLTHYQFKLVGHESVETPAGTFDALKMERIDNPNKEGHFWLAAERDYMPVKIETRSGNKPAVTMLLSK